MQSEVFEEELKLSEGLNGIDTVMSVRGFYNERHKFPKER